MGPQRYSPLKKNFIILAAKWETFLFWERRNILEKPKFPTKIPFYMSNSTDNEPNFTLSRFQKDRIMRSLIIATQI